MAHSLLCLDLGFPWPHLLWLLITGHTCCLADLPLGDEPGSCSQVSFYLGCRQLGQVTPASHGDAGGGGCCGLDFCSLRFHVTVWQHGDCRGLQRWGRPLACVMPLHGFFVVWQLCRAEPILIPGTRGLVQGQEVGVHHQEADGVGWGDCEWRAIAPHTPSHPRVQLQCPEQVHWGQLGCRAAFGRAETWLGRGRWVRPWSREGGSPWGQADTGVLPERLPGPAGTGFLLVKCSWHPVMAQEAPRGVLLRRVAWSCPWCPPFPVPPGAGRAEECGAEAAEPLPALLLQPLPVSASPPHRPVLPPSVAPSLLQPPVQPPMQSELLPPKPVPVYSDAVRSPAIVVGKHPAVLMSSLTVVCVSGVSVPLMDGPRPEHPTQVWDFILPPHCLGRRWAPSALGNKEAWRVERKDRRSWSCVSIGGGTGAVWTAVSSRQQACLSCPEGSCLLAGNLTRCAWPSLVWGSFRHLQRVSSDEVLQEFLTQVGRPVMSLWLMEYLQYSWL